MHECPRCGKQTDGEITNGGIRISTCPECWQRELAASRIEEEWESNPKNHRNQCVVCGFTIESGELCGSCAKEFGGVPDDYMRDIPAAPL